MRYGFLLLLLLIKFNGFSQKDVQKYFPDDLDKGSYLKLNFLSIADLALPTIQPGYEYKFSDKLGLEMAVGIPIQWIGHRKTDSTFFSYYKVRSTLKYYVRDKFYIGLEGFFTHAHYNRQYFYYDLQKNGGLIRYSSDYAVAQKNVVGFDFKFGKISSLGKNLYLENFAGFGGRFVHIKLLENINPHEVTYYRSYAFQTFDVVGLKITPHLTFGIQLCYNL